LLGPEWEEESLAEGERARELNPLTPNFVGALAWQYADACRYEDALRLAREAIRLDPEHPTGWLALGLTYSELGQFDEAIDAHERLEGTVWSWVIGMSCSSSAMGGRPHSSNSAPTSSMGMSLSAKWPKTPITVRRGVTRFPEKRISVDFSRSEAMKTGLLRWPDMSSEWPSGSSIVLTMALVS